MNTPGTMTKVGAATHILAGIGAPINQHTVGAMVGWFNAEGGNWGNNAAFNPLNTTLSAPGARAINPVGVKAYGNWGQGLSAIVQTLKQPNMSGIVQAFHSSNPSLIAHAIGSSPWGTGGGLVSQTISAATGQHFAIPSSTGIARQMTPGHAAPQTGGSSFAVDNSMTPGTSRTDWGAALTQALLNGTTSKGSGSNPLAGAEYLVGQGGFTTTTPSQAHTAVAEVPGPAGAPVAGPAGKRAQAALGKSGGDVNPLGHPGWVIGRTDQGVDANARPGTPIVAMNTSRVVDIQPNWYAGQPLVLMQLVSGPNAGKYWYVAEQIAQGLHRGQVIQRGAPVASYAGSGTGIEIGWGHPGGGDTLAQFTGQTGDSSHGNAPAGVAFRRYALNLPRG